MAPRLKILMASGSEKGTQIYFSFSQKSRQTKLLQVPQQVPNGKGGPLTGQFAYLSKTFLSRFPVKEPSFKVPFMESLAEGYHTTTALLYSSVKVCSI